MCGLHPTDVVKGVLDEGQKGHCCGVISWWSDFQVRCVKGMTSVW